MDQAKQNFDLRQQDVLSGVAVHGPFFSLKDMQLRQ